MMDSNSDSAFYGQFLETCEDRVALLETPKGFALILIDKKVFTNPDAIWAWLTDVDEACHVARVIEYRKVKDKSVCKLPDGPGKELSKLIKKYFRSGNKKELYVEDKELRRVIYSNLKIKCSDDQQVVDEVMWGLRNVMDELIFEEQMSPGFQKKAACRGLIKCIDEYKLSAEAIDDPEFILHAAGLYRCHTTLQMTKDDLRMACERYVPGIGVLIKDDLCYAEVMAKILTPGLEPDWEFTQKFDTETALKLKQAEAKVIADKTREEVGFQMYHFLYATFLNLRGLPEIITKATKFLDSYVNGRRSVGQGSPIVKGSKSDLTESCVTGDAGEGSVKRSRIDELSNE